MTHVSDRDNTPGRQAGGRQARGGGKPKRPERERGGTQGRRETDAATGRKAKKGGPTG